MHLLLLPFAYTRAREAGQGHLQRLKTWWNLHQAVRIRFLQVFCLPGEIELCSFYKNYRLSAHIAY